MWLKCVVKGLSMGVILIAIIRTSFRLDLILADIRSRCLPPSATFPGNVHGVVVHASKKTSPVKPKLLRILHFELHIHARVFRIVLIPLCDFVRGECGAATRAPRDDFVILVQEVCFSCAVFKMFQTDSM